MYLSGMSRTTPTTSRGCSPEATSSVKRFPIGLLVRERRSHHLKAAALFLPGKVIRDRGIAALLRILQGKRPDDHEPVCMREREISEQNTTHHAKNCGVAADAQSQRGDRDDAESRIPAQHAGAVAQVQPQIVQPRDARWSRHSSSSSPALPSVLRAALRASPGGMPSAMFS